MTRCCTVCFKVGFSVVCVRQLDSKMPTNPDLQKERDGASFPIEELTHVIEGGKDNTSRRRYIQSLALNDADFQIGDKSFLSREEQYSLGIKTGILVEKKIQEHNFKNEDEKMRFRNTVTRNRHGNNVALHTLMFIPTIEGQGSKEQQRKWLPLAEKMQVIGTYAQTELGHGTFVRGLETTATYLKGTEEFVLNSPTLTSMKWWPGSLGKTVNHAVVMAQLYIQGKKYGIHAFIVQLRSLETHEPMPGVTIGDIGPKFGFNSNDNGFLKLDHVHIPRENMLMRYAKVSADGRYTKPPTDKLAYGSMMYVRISYLVATAEALAMACTIAIRYSAVRRQSEMKPGGKEPQVLDYQSQQLKLFPWLARAYALYFVHMKSRKIYNNLLAELANGDYRHLQDMHALSCGLKAFSTSTMNRGLEICRLACGGHGYSNASGLPDLYTMCTHFQTAEGENTVMLLQTARYLVKMASNAFSGDRQSGQAEYLFEAPQQQANINDQSDLLRLEVLCETFKHRAQRLVMDAARKLQEKMAAGKPQHVAWNTCHMYLLSAATAHCEYYAMKAFAEVVVGTQMSASVKQVLVSLCQLYALIGIQENAGDFLQDGYFSGDQVAMVNSEIVSLLATLRPNAVALVDAFDFPDRVLGSILGRYDGNVYENMYEWAKQSPLNKDEVHHSYYTYLRPLIQANASKL